MPAVGEPSERGWGESNAARRGNTTNTRPLGIVSRRPPGGTEHQLEEGLRFP
jgi:hypothetical protein